MTEQELSLEPQSDWDCKTQLDRIEAMCKEILANQNKPKRTNGSRQSEYSADFDELWKRYPARSGGNPKAKACGSVKARLKEGVLLADLTAGLDRYVAYVASEGLAGGTFVMQAARFFGVNKEYEGEWLIDKKTKQPKTELEWLQVGREHNIFARTGESHAEFQRRVEVASR